MTDAWWLLIGALDFWGLSIVIYSRIIRQDPDPPSLSEPIPSFADLLGRCPAPRILWTDQPQVAHYDPFRQRMTLSRQWAENGPALVACHVVAHERHHADQPRWWAMLAGLNIMFAFGWGIAAGVIAPQWPLAIWMGALAQWIYDGAVRRRVEGDADAGAIRRLITALTDVSDQNRVQAWADHIAQRHRLALAVEGLGWSGVTLMIAASVSWGMVQIH